MEPWLNYHHLLYFHAIVREGSVTAAARKLRLAQPTLSGQVKVLEDTLGEPLFERRGRRLELTEAGRLVYAYAEEIFGLGQELLQTVQGRPVGGPRRLAVGVADALPKLVVVRLLAPAMALEGGVRLEVRDGDVPSLVADLQAHRLDLVLSDGPLPAGGVARATQHALGECGVSFFAAPALAARLGEGFPACLEGAPMLLPPSGSALRRALDVWFDDRGLTPSIVGEFSDSALLKAFGEGGAGALAAPSVVAREVEEQYGLRSLGATDEVRERFWAIVGERRVRHPAVHAVLDGARSLFA